MQSWMLLRKKLNFWTRNGTNLSYSLSFKVLLSQFHCCCAQCIGPLFSLNFPQQQQIFFKLIYFYFVCLELRRSRATYLKLLCVIYQLTIKNKDIPKSHQFNSRSSKTYLNLFCTYQVLLLILEDLSQVQTGWIFFLFPRPKKSTGSQVLVICQARGC